jgi:hypothetical protein
MLASGQAYQQEHVCVACLSKAAGSSSGTTSAHPSTSHYPYAWLQFLISKSQLSLSAAYSSEI